MEYFLFSIIVFTLSLFILKIYFNGPFTNIRKRLDGKIIIITGPSSGIGKETATQLLEDGAKVIFANVEKNETKAIIKKLPEKLKELAYYIKLDLCCLSSIDKFVKKFLKKFKKLDILINNAGVCPVNFKLTEDGIESVLQINHIGQMYLTVLLLKHFDKNDGRIINSSSLSYKYSDITEKKIKEAFYDIEFKNIEKNYYNGLLSRYFLYCNTKRAILYFTSYLAEHLEQGNYPNIKVCSIMPGIVTTNILKPMLDLFPYKSFILRLLYPILYLFVKTPKAGAQTGLHVSYMKFEELINGGNYQDCKLHFIDESNQERDIRNLYINYSLFLINVISRRELDLGIQ